MRQQILQSIPCSRRSMLGALAAGAAGSGVSGWMPGFARAFADDPRRKRHCVLLWMPGGPTQTDTFDMKPGHLNGGEFQEIATSVPGLRFSEHLPRLAQLAEHLAIIRGMSTGEGDHGRGTYLMRTGRSPEGVIRYPAIGAALSKELGSEDATLPNFVSIASSQNFNRAAFQSGFLGPRHAPLVVDTRDDFRTFAQFELEQDFARLGVADLQPPPEVGLHQAAQRVQLLHTMQSTFAAAHPGGATATHQATLERAVRMVHGEAGEAFDLSQENDATRERYGRGRFGQGCLLARRLIERGVPFVEVSLGGQGRWDTHTANFETVAALSAELDAGWSSLMEDLRDRGLLESTTILWMGEFGRTPRINGGAGRDHYPQAWSTVLAGGGINGGQAWGRTDAGGESIVDGMVDTGNLLTTLCHALGVNPRIQNISNVGRPIRIAEGRPIKPLLTEIVATEV